ncbi:MAG TPA: hypothetical protein VLV78_19075 [Thermoanaerobaculia bacterium]|nr:hypothetical protein [Thermoanaerobaculia bacterium]
MVAGHSMGAYAALAPAGLENGEETFRDPPLMNIAGTADMSLVDRAVLRSTALSSG